VRVSSYSMVECLETMFISFVKSLSELFSPFAQNTFVFWCAASYNLTACRTEVYRNRKICTMIEQRDSIPSTAQGRPRSEYQTNHPSLFIRGAPIFLLSLHILLRLPQPLCFLPHLFLHALAKSHKFRQSLNIPLHHRA
jgi:hypothetical protein